LSRGRIAPPNFDERDDWIGFVTQGGLKQNIPSWMFWLARRNRKPAKALDSDADNASINDDADVELKQVTVDSRSEHVSHT
ncbi:hypothetical protein IWW35_005790, partial [Coemansia sp. RSA 1878]